MSRTRQNRKGFTLVELLAVVLVLAALAAIAIPLYTAQRQSAAARTCKANIATLSKSLSAYALRNRAYPAALASLVGTAEGITSVPVCPMQGSAYTYSVDATTHIASLACTDAGAHQTNGQGTSADYTKSLPAPASDSLP